MALDRTEFSVGENAFWFPFEGWEFDEFVFGTIPEGDFSREIGDKDSISVPSSVHELESTSGRNFVF